MKTFCTFRLGNSLSCLTLLMLSLGASSTFPQTSSTKVTVKRTAPCAIPESGNGVLTLDVVFEGTIGLVQMQDGSLEVFFPQVMGHTSPYFLGLNEGILGQFKAGDYTIQAVSGGFLTPAPCSTYIPPDADWPILRATYTNYATDIDPLNSRYVSIVLPQPYAIIPMHGDPAELKPNDPCDTPSTNPMLPNYATRVALRYIVQDFKLQLKDPDPSSKPIPLSIPQIGSSGSLFFGIGPEQPDDETHHHARAAFQKLRSLFKIPVQYVAFPLGPPTNRDRVRSGIDCRAPMLLLQLP